MEKKKLFKYVGTVANANGILLLGETNKWSISGVLVYVPEKVNEDAWFVGAECVNWTYDGDNWVDVTDQEIELIEQPVTYSIGDRFDITDNGEEKQYMMVSAGVDSVLLASLTTGNRWLDPIKVDNHTAITVAEFKSICTHGKFTKVEK